VPAAAASPGRCLAGEQEVFSAGQHPHSSSVHRSIILMHHGDDASGIAINGLSSALRRTAGQSCNNRIRPDVRRSLPTLPAWLALCALQTDHLVHDSAMRTGLDGLPHGENKSIPQWLTWVSMYTTHRHDDDLFTTYCTYVGTQISPAGSR
jgi:hypothetical protein